MILITEYIDKAYESGKYISCAYCGSIMIVISGKYDSWRDCMEAGEIDIRKV